ncbi:MAG: PilZ domain-containing protein [Nitrospira sp.]|nr:PilZ domain-containing protein [Nitrospira sp.]MCP9441321.1 PilZ domain-containing protein [Nitrospira sp.]
MERARSGQTLRTRAREDSRHAERVAYTCPVSFTGEIPSQPHQGEGLTQNISVTGLKIVSAQPVTRGTLLTLSLALPDGHPPLRIHSAHVVWVSGAHFSVRFLHLSQEHRKRILSFVLRHIGKEAMTDHWSRFRIA